MNDSKELPLTRGPGGLGCDIVHIPRFKDSLDRTPNLKTKLFTDEELKDRSPASLAGLYAAKEAVIKACGLTLSDLPTIHITHSKEGRPICNTHPCQISISHDGDYAFAVALLSQNK